MYISRWRDWLEQVDPYAMYRIMFHKSLFTAVVMVFVYWTLRPPSFLLYILSTFSIIFYETPLLTNYLSKSNATLLILVATAVGGITFYLIYPFKFFFLYYALMLFTACYWFINQHYPVLNAAMMCILVNAAFTTTLAGDATWQRAYDMTWSAALSIMVMFLCVRLYPNLYLSVWIRAFQKYIVSLINQTGQSNSKTILSLLTNSNLLLAYQQIIPRKYWRLTHKAISNLRYVHFALSVLGEQQDIHDITLINTHLERYAKAVLLREACPPFEDQLAIEGPLKHYVGRRLNVSISSWNKLIAERPIS